MNLIQVTSTFTNVGKNPLEEMVQPSVGSEQMGMFRLSYPTFCK